MVAFDPQGSTAALNSAGYLDSPAGRASYSADTGATSYPAASTIKVDANGKIISNNTSTSSSPSPGATVTNPGANKDLLNSAQQAAYQAYLNAKLNLDTDDLAFRKAQDAFSQTIQEAALTGTYKGAPTQAAIQQQANITGYDANGRPTLAREGQQQQTAQGYLGLIAGLKGPQDYGQYLRTIASTPGGLKDLVASAAGQYTPASGATTGVAPVAASLGGVLADIGGNAGIPGAAPVGQVPGAAAPGQPAAPAGPQIQATRGTPDPTSVNQLGAGVNPGDIGPAYVVNGRVQQEVRGPDGKVQYTDLGPAPSGAANYTRATQDMLTPAAATDANRQVAVPTPAAAAPGQYTLSNYTPMPVEGSTATPAQIAAGRVTTAAPAPTPNTAGAAYGNYMTTAQGLPAPNQISPAAWNAYTSSQKQLLLGMYGSTGWQPQDVQDLYAQSLPKYSYNSGVSGTVKL